MEFETTSRDPITASEEFVLARIDEHFVAVGLDATTGVGPYQGEAGVGNVIEAIETLCAQRNWALASYNGQEWTEWSTDDAVWRADGSFSVYVCARHLSDQSTQAREAYRILTEASRAFRGVVEVLIDDPEETWKLMIQKIRPGSIAPIINAPGIVVFMLTLKADLIVGWID